MDMVLLYLMYNFNPKSLYFHSEQAHYIVRDTIGQFTIDLGSQAGT